MLTNSCIMKKWMTIQSEKQVKKWKRKWKIDLIEETNPGWNDLAKDWFDSL